MAILLYVDDEQAIGRAVARWFGRRGHAVHLAVNVAQAQRVLEEHEPSVVFLDVWLGTESGFELMSWIEDTRPSLAERVVFVTGEPPDDTRRERLWRTLGRPVVQKPFDFAQLESFVQRDEDTGTIPERPVSPPDAESRSGA